VSVPDLIRNRGKARSRDCGRVALEGTLTRPASQSRLATADLCHGNRGSERKCAFCSRDERVMRSVAEDIGVPVNDAEPSTSELHPESASSATRDSRERRRLGCR